ncbi:MAG: hypothetical protein OEX02_07205, partial [Cyclobacteriaceae bacterium]|nr:hypothetical protein [Cyclobacteriaceae bacterium]
MEETYPVPADKKMIGTTNAFVLDYELLGHADQDLWVGLEVAAHYGGMAQDDTTLHFEDFKPADFEDYQVFVESVEKVRAKEITTYSNLVALDLSTGWKDFDNFNLKTRAISRFLKEGKAYPDNKIAYSEFARNGVNNRDFSPWVWDDEKALYEQSYEDLTTMVFHSYYSEGGSSNLYDALIQAIDFVELQQGGGHANKNITVIAHGLPDNENLMTADDVVTRARQHGVKINMVALTDKNTWDMLALPSRTG